MRNLWSLNQKMQSNGAKLVDFIIGFNYNLYMTELDKLDHFLTVSESPEDPYKLMKDLGHDCGSRGFGGFGEAIEVIIGERGSPERIKAFIESVAEAAAAVELRMGQENLYQMGLQGPSLNPNYDPQNPAYRQLALATCQFLTTACSIITQDPSNTRNKS